MSRDASTINKPWALLQGSFFLLITIGIPTTTTWLGAYIATPPARELMGPFKNSDASIYNVAAASSALVSSIPGLPLFLYSMACRICLENQTNEFYNQMKTWISSIFILNFAASFISPFLYFLLKSSRSLDDFFDSGKTGLAVGMGNLIISSLLGIMFISLFKSMECIGKKSESADVFNAPQIVIPKEAHATQTESHRRIASYEVRAIETNTTTAIVGPDGQRALAHTRTASIEFYPDRGQPPLPGYASPHSPASLNGQVEALVVR